MIGYLSGQAIRQLIEAGVTQVWHGTSETPAHRGDLVSVYFFNKEDVELAHQTQLAGQCGTPEVTVFTRNWGESIRDRGYQRTFRWNLFMSEVATLNDSSTYRVV